MFLAGRFCRLIWRRTWAHRQWQEGAGDIFAYTRKGPIRSGETHRQCFLQCLKVAKV